MTIKGLTDRDSANMRYPLVGRLKKGGPKPTDRQGSGKELPHFRFVGATEIAQETWDNLIGATSKRLVAYLPYPTVEQNWMTAIEAWNPGNKRLVWRSDGERTSRIWLNDKGSYSDRAEDQLSHDLACASVKKEWIKSHGRLSLVFRELLDAGCVGVVSLTTTGIHDLARISGALYRLESDCRTRPNGLAYVEIALERRPVQRPDQSGKKWTHHDVYLFPAESYVIAQLEAMRQDMVAQLPPGTTVVDSETGEIIEQTPKREEVIKSEPKAEKVPAKADTILPEGVQADPTGKQAAVSSGKWAAAAIKLASECPYYADTNGKPNYYHMVGAAGKCGVIKITDGNLATVIHKLLEYAAMHERGIPSEAQAKLETAISRDEESDPASLFDADDVPF